MKKRSVQIRRGMVRWKGRGRGRTGGLEVQRRWVHGDGQQSGPKKVGRFELALLEEEGGRPTTAMNVPSSEDLKRQLNMNNQVNQSTLVTPSQRSRSPNIQTTYPNHRNSAPDPV